ncbi:MAG: hypothetical protein WAN69_07100 [Candidatus Korobacteraceae bacterium]
MQNWKKAVVFGSIGAGALLILAGRRPIGMALAAGGLAVLASEYPEKFEGLLENAPDYLHKGMEIFSTMQKVGAGFVNDAEQRGVNAWRDMNAQFGD